jgi:uridine monophosphate synthetase
MWLLVPGVGTQGGELRATLQAGLRSDGLGLLINVSRAICGAKDPKEAARKLCAEIDELRQTRSSLHPLAAALVRSECVRFGSFKLKSGKVSPIYIDLRRLVGFPDVLKLVAKEYARILRSMTFERLAGLPYAALPIATAISVEMGVPLIYPRREVKEYGTKAAIEGVFERGDRVVIIDDLVTTGETKIEAIEKMSAAGLRVIAIVVLIDREMGAKAFLGKHGYHFDAVASLSQLLPLWKKSGSISDEQLAEVKEFMSKL